MVLTYDPALDPDMFRCVACHGWSDDADGVCMNCGSPVPDDHHRYHYLVDVGGEG